LSVACCEEARGLLSTPKCSRHASQPLALEPQVATGDWQLKKRFSGITGRVVRLMQGGDGERHARRRSQRDSTLSHQRNAPPGRSPGSCRFPAVRGFGEFRRVRSRGLPFRLREGKQRDRRKNVGVARDDGHQGGLLNRISSKGCRYRSSSRLSSPRLSAKGSGGL